MKRGGYFAFKQTAMMKCVVLLWFLLAFVWFSGLAYAQQVNEPSADDGFNPNANYIVRSIVVQADGKILVGGWFTTIGGQTRNCIARLRSDETALQSFAVSNDGTTMERRWRKWDIL